MLAPLLNKLVKAASEYKRKVGLVIPEAVKVKVRASPSQSVSSELPLISPAVAYGLTVTVTLLMD
ncbi:hypothetical protein D3C78_885730 [compost metagenome]